MTRARAAPFARRLLRWSRQPYRRQLASLARHSRRLAERIATPLFRVFAAFDGVVSRGARFDALLPRTEYLLRATRDDETYVVFTQDREISRQLFVHGSFDFDKFEKALAILADHSLRPDLLVDVGANIGSICIPAVRRGLVARALAFEPEPHNFRLLMVNVLLNGLTEKIVAHNLALGSEDDQSLAFAISRDHRGDHRVHTPSDHELYGESGRQTITVPSHRLDRYGEHFSRSSTLLWLDTQGYEGWILSGAREIIAKRVPVVMELWPYGIRRMRAFSPIKDAVRHYEVLIDLSDPDRRCRSVDELDVIYERLGEQGAFTDLLLM